MATLQGKAVKNTYRQVLQIGANNIGVSGTLQPVQDGAGNNTALSLSTLAATVNGDLTITGDLIITGGGIQIQDLIDDTVATLIQNGTGITWAYNDTARTLTPTITIATADGGVQGDYLQLNTNANEASAVGKLKWNTTDGTLDIGLMGGQVVLQVGQEQVARVLNNSGSILTEAGYQAVKITSAQGQRLAVGLAQANNEANSKDTLGLVTENIANNQEGFVTTSGLVRQIDTTGDLQSEVWVDGDTLYLSPTVPGGVTKVKPLAPQQTVIVGFVVYAHKTQGKIFVKVDNGYEISELHDVRITSVANNNVLKYNSSLAVWENVVPSTTWITEGTNLYYTQARFDSAFAAKTTTNLAEGTNLYFTETRATNNFDTNLAASTTTDLSEGTNLYWTNQRFDSRFSTKTTTDLAEGTNLYYTQARFNTAFAAKSTTDLAEGTNLYYTDARARAAFSENAVGLDYSSGSGVLSLTSGYAIPTTVKLGEYDTAYNRSIVSAGVSGTSSKTLTLTKQDGNTITASWTDQGITTINGTANQIATSTVGNTTTVGFTNDVTFPNNVVVSGNLTINGTATYVNTQSISSKDPLFEVANDNNTTDAVDIGYYGRYYDSAQTRVEFTGLFRDASDAGKYKIFSGLVDEPTNVVDTTGTGYTVGTLVANVEGNLAGTANAANVLSTARSISATGDAAWTVSFDGSANATAALTLANTGVTATTYGTSTSVPTIAVDAKGRITSASNTNIAFPVTTVNGFSGTVVLTTSDVAEGSNQYFTSARAQASITGGASSVVTSNLTASRALVSDGSGKIAASASTTATEVSYLAGVTSAIQTQLNTKAADNAVVHLAGTETITGAKTFSGGLSSNALTLTGAATFAGDVTMSSTSNYGSTLTFGLASNGGTLTWSGTDLQIFSKASKGFLLGVNGSTTALTLASTGAATFSSSVAIKNTLTLDRYGDGTETGVFSNNTGNLVINATGGNNIKFQGNGTDRFYIANSSGNVGIGTTSPQDKFEVVGASFFRDSNAGVRVGGAATYGFISAYTANFGASAPLALQTGGGNVGISETAPSSKLSIGGVQGSTIGSNVALLVGNNGAAGTVGNLIQIGLHYNPAGATPASIIGAVLTSTSSFTKSDIFFATRDVTTDTAPTERMRITNNGNVGIGTSIPASYTGWTALTLNNITNGGLIDFQNNGTRYASIYNDSETFNIGSISNIPFRFLTGATERMRITSGGNVGIGTSSPTSIFHVETSSTLRARFKSTSNSSFLDIENESNSLYIGTDNSTGSDFGVGAYSSVIWRAAAYPIIFATNNAERMRITSSGDVLIGATSIFNDGKLCVSADATRVTIASKVSASTGAEHIRFINPNGIVGYISTSGTSTSYSTSSDYRLKQDLKDYNGLSLVSAIKTYDYEWKSDNSRSYGVLAHELQEVIPQAVHGEKDGEKMQGVDYSKLVPVLVKAIQEQQAQIEELKALIAAK